MDRITDRDIAYDSLYGCKALATVYMEATMESASNRMRNLFHRLHDDCLEDQWRIWQYLHRKNEYRVDEISAQAMDGMRRRMEHLARTHRERAERGAGGSGGFWQGERSWNESYPEAGSFRGRDGGSRDVGFDPAPNMPNGTQFEPDREFAGGGAYASESAYGGERRGQYGSGYRGERGRGTTFEAQEGRTSIGGHTEGGYRGTEGAFGPSAHGWSSEPYRTGSRR